MTSLFALWAGALLALANAAQLGLTTHLLLTRRPRAFRPRLGFVLDASQDSLAFRTVLFCLCLRVANLPCSTRLPLDSRCRMPAFCLGILIA